MQLLEGRKAANKGPCSYYQRTTERNTDATNMVVAATGSATAAIQGQQMLSELGTLQLLLEVSHLLYCTS
jgi:hypothetical protein